MRKRSGFGAAVLAVLLLSRVVMTSGVSAATAGFLPAADRPGAEQPVEQPADSPTEPPEAPEEADSPSADDLAELPKSPEQQAEITLLWPLSDDTAETAAPEAETALEFDPAEARGIAIAGAAALDRNPETLLTAPLALDFSGGGPKILILHTHGSEAYTATAGWEYTPSDTLRTEDGDYSVIRVGREMEAVFAEHGIACVHDETLYDYPSYNGAYGRMLEAEEAWLEQYPSIQIVLDVHRDAAENPDGSPMTTAVELDGESVAQLMLVMGTDQGGLTFPGWRDNLSCALKVQALLNRQAPGLCRNLELRTERFNQHVRPGAMLVEVGSAGDTLPEAMAAGRYFAEAVAALIEGSSAGAAAPAGA